jgi:hypothetical protein
MRIIILVILLTLLAPVAIAQWSQPALIGTRISDEKLAVSGNTIYAVGGVSPFHFMKSVNNGATWSQTFTPAPADSFYGCDMPDIIYSKGTIHIAFVAYFLYGERQKVYHISSTDGGATWSAPHRVFNNIHCAFLKYPKLAANGDTLFLSCRIASDIDSYILAFRSFNAGFTWQDSTVAEPLAWLTDSDPTMLYSIGRVHLIYQMSFLDPDSSGIEIFYRQSSDYGLSWGPRVALSNFPDHEHGQFPYASTDGLGYIIVSWFDYLYGSQCSVTGDILTRISIDNGENWLPMGRITYTQSGQQSASLIIGNTFHVIWNDTWLYGCSYPKLMYSQSTDWGISWSEPALISDSQAVAERSVNFTYTIVNQDTTLHAFMVREDTSGTNGLFLIRNQSIESIGEGNGAASLPDKLALSAYPNPFNSSTIISIDGTKQAEIAIYDITGRRAATLQAENGKVVWDASSFSSGVYFARVVGEDISKSVKLILLK